MLLLLGRDIMTKFSVVWSYIIAICVALNVVGDELAITQVYRYKRGLLALNQASCYCPTPGSGAGNTKSGQSVAVSSSPLVASGSSSNNAVSQSAGSANAGTQGTSSSANSVPVAGIAAQPAGQNVGANQGPQNIVNAGSVFQAGVEVSVFVTTFVQTFVTTLPALFDGQPTSVVSTYTSIVTVTSTTTLGQQIAAAPRSTTTSAGQQIAPAQSSTTATTAASILFSNSTIATPSSTQLMLPSATVRAAAIFTTFGSAIAAAVCREFFGSTTVTQLQAGSTINQFDSTAVTFSSTSTTTTGLIVVVSQTNTVYTTTTSTLALPAPTATDTLLFSSETTTQTSTTTLTSTTSRYDSFTTFFPVSTSTSTVTNAMTRCAAVQKRQTNDDYASAASELSAQALTAPGDDSATCSSYVPGRSTSTQTVIGAAATFTSTSTNTGIAVQTITITETATTTATGSSVSTLVLSTSTGSRTTTSTTAVATSINVNILTSISESISTNIIQATSTVVVVTTTTTDAYYTCAQIISNPSYEDTRPSYAAGWQYTTAVPRSGQWSYYQIKFINLAAGASQSYYFTLSRTEQYYVPFKNGGNFKAVFYEYVYEFNPGRTPYTRTIDPVVVASVRNTDTGLENVVTLTPQSGPSTGSYRTYIGTFENSIEQPAGNYEAIITYTNNVTVTAGPSDAVQYQYGVFVDDTTMVVYSQYA